MCGIVGIYKTSDDVCSEIYDGLIQVQHRGQDAAGISTWDGSKMHLQKELGLVTEAFKTGEFLLSPCWEYWNRACSISHSWIR